jgi:hypothetical protein
VGGRIVDVVGEDARRREVLANLRLDGDLLTWTSDGERREHRLGG